MEKQKRIVIEAEIEITVTTEIPRKKRKYTKKSTMLLRSNNDYIDHDYWPRMYAKQKLVEQRMRIEHPERYAKVVKEPEFGIMGKTTTRKISPEQLRQQEIDNCSIYGIVCSKHNMVHTTERK